MGDSAPRGWYLPSPDSDTQRLWDGARWTDNVRDLRRPAAGWYRLPLDPATHGFWDGDAWTGQVLAGRGGGPVSDSHPRHELGVGPNSDVCVKCGLHSRNFPPGEGCSDRSMDHPPSPQPLPGVPGEESTATSQEQPEGESADEVGFRDEVVRHLTEIEWPRDVERPSSGLVHSDLVPAEVSIVLLLHSLPHGDVDSVRRLVGRAPNGANDLGGYFSVLVDDWAADRIKDRWSHLPSAIPQSHVDWLMQSYKVIAKLLIRLGLARNAQRVATMFAEAGAEARKGNKLAAGSQLFLTVAFNAAVQGELEQVPSVGESNEPSWLLRISSSPDRRNADAAYVIGSLAGYLGVKDAASTQYRLAAELGNSDAMNELGRLAKKAGQLDTARTWYLRAAENGNSDAMFNLGLNAYQAGDQAAARTWWARAADHGDSDAMRGLSRFAAEDGDEDAAITWLRRAADRGDAEAIFLLGELAKRFGG